MALTLEQKKQVLENIITFMTHEDYATTTFTSRELANALDATLNPTSITNMLKDYIHYNSEDACIEIVGEAPYKFQAINPTLLVKITGYEKVKNLLVFKVEREGLQLTYDFNTKQFTSNIENPIIRCNNYDYMRLYNALKQGNCLEWLFNYPDLCEDVNTLINTHFDCPKGYINFLRNNQLTINSTSYTMYKLVQQVNNEALGLKYYHYIYESKLTHYLRREETNYLVNHLDVLDKLQKCYKTDVLNFNLVENPAYEMLKIIEYVMDMDDTSVIDTNRGLKYNKSTLYELRNKAQVERINHNLHKLNFLNGQRFSNYVVVVPQSVNDLVDEGQQQHNCVGHYYNDSIARGENLIYFLRYESNPTKSVVTCRYNVDYQRTIEHRIVNNYDTNGVQNAIIRDIDKIINSQL